MVQRTNQGLLAILAQTKFFVSLVTLMLVLYTQSVHVVYFVVGSCSTAVLAKILKRYWQQPRPYGQDGYGMPSTHSQVIMFFATYFQCVGTNTMPWLVLIVSLFSLAVVWSRVQLKYHTLTQVLVGSVLGVLSALLWYTVWSLILHPMAISLSIDSFDMKDDRIRRYIYVDK
ncbi:phosphatidic acid phosphatase type 2/haloperoxidase [Halteromyces radiatus]|uniref:phosphatidic acid phosphatase type 2/haloperoxidase n=1 Tax=Halteromyces radiatus TaxID=101107 RepID=UPI0022201B9A|nr:phosphatidic acid phosphatase type 2/haloperoxidase [Halteromyces radiatus]KAI8099972.1 phosphatidic acid phosphatase type 2/haloperoxidase [Halteromyces radiatus]